MALSWGDISARLGLQNAQGFAQDSILPYFQTLDESQAGKPPQKGAVLPVIFGVVVFLVLWIGALNVLPSNGIGEAARFISMPIIFIFVFLSTVFVFRERLTDSLIRPGQDRFIANSQALGAISAKLGIEYVGMPGGPSELMRKVANWKYSPQGLKEAVEVMDDHGGFEDITDIVRQSGLAIPSAIFLGSDEAYEKYYQHELDQQQFEDGFRGRRGRIDFAALEWIESHSESQTPHLLIVMQLPTKLTGKVELKSKHTNWPSRQGDTKLKAVGLLRSKFDKRFKVRATDKVEAHLIFNPLVMERVTELAHGENIRAVAFGSNLVFDIAGKNRFQIVDLLLGTWSDETLRQSFTDIIETLALVDAVSDAFLVKPARRKA